MRSSRFNDLVVEGDLAADQAGIAALRHDRRLGLVGEFEDRGDFGDRSRPQHHGRVAAEQIAHLHQVGRLRLRILDGEFVADDGDETGQQFGADGFGGRGVRLI
jgi:hypothetical protein